MKGNKKSTSQINISIEVRKYYGVVLIGIVFLFGGIMVVMGYGKGPAFQFGHSASEIEGIPLCNEGEFLTYYGGEEMECVVLSSSEVLVDSRKYMTNNMEENINGITIPPNRCKNAIRVDMFLEAKRLDGEGDYKKQFVIRDNGNSGATRGVDFGADHYDSPGHSWLYTVTNTGSYYIESVTIEHVLQPEMNCEPSGCVDGNGNQAVDVTAARWNVVCL
jgi:hypothetical protein